MDHWVKFLKVVARMERRGIPFDSTEYFRIQSSRPTIKSVFIGDVNKYRLQKLEPYHSSRSRLSHRVLMLRLYSARRSAEPKVPR